MPKREKAPWGNFRVTFGTNCSWKMGRVWWINTLVIILLYLQASSTVKLFFKVELIRTGNGFPGMCYLWCLWESNTILIPISCTEREDDGDKSNGTYRFWFWGTMKPWATFLTSLHLFSIMYWGQCYPEMNRLLESNSYQMWWHLIQILLWP